MFRVAPPLRRWLIAILAVTVGACSNVPARRSIEFFAAFVDPGSSMSPYGGAPFDHSTRNALGLPDRDAFAEFLGDLRSDSPSGGHDGADLLAVRPSPKPRIWRTFFDTPLVDASGHPVPR